MTDDRDNGAAERLQRFLDARDAQRPWLERHGVQLPETVAWQGGYASEDLSAPKPIVYLNEADLRTVLAEWREMREWRDGLPWQHGQALKLRRELEAERDQYLLLINDLTDPGDCDFGHRGGCQAHGYLSLEPGQLCPHAEAKQLLANGNTEETS